jgi:hypothetical protein
MDEFDYLGAREAPARKRRPRPTAAMGTAAAVLALLGVGVLAVLHFASKPASLLPPGIAKQINGFTPYFYYKQVPGRYAVQTAQITYGNGVLIVPLEGPDGTRLVLTEQAMPADLSARAVQQNGKAVETSTGKATINGVEGRQVATLIPYRGRVLILINATAETNPDDLGALLQQLKPVSL